MRDSGATAFGKCVNTSTATTNAAPAATRHPRCRPRMKALVTWELSAPYNDAGRRATVVWATHVDFAADRDASFELLLVTLRDGFR